MRPRKRSFAKANPASVEVSTTLIVMIVQTTRELRRPRKKFTSGLVSTRPKFAKNELPGVNGGGVLLIASSARVAMTNM